MPKTKSKPTSSKLTWLPKKTFELDFTLPWDKVKKTYGLVLDEAVKQAQIKGFRKGKAPRHLVEKNLDKQKVYQEVLNKLLPETYEKAVKQHNLKPIMVPKITPVSAQENKDWQFKAVACERPEIKLGDYEKLVKGELNKSKIWTPARSGYSVAGGPGKGASDKKEEVKPNYDQKLNLVTKTLITSIKMEIPDLLIEDELNRMLSRLLDQVNKLGMTIDQYLKSKGMTNEQLRANYHQQAENTLKFEFILQEIVKDRKIKIEKKEVDKMIAATPDKKVQEKLDTPMQRSYITSILAKRKALDYLISL